MNNKDYIEGMKDFSDGSEMLKKHKLWLEDKEGGQRANLEGADLIGADLIGANLRRADLRRANLRDADLRDADLEEADLIGANLEGANLEGANLEGANLRDADLEGANLDFSCLPLWCGSLSAQFDDKQLIQIAYHLVKAGLNSKNASDETKDELCKLIDFANKFHMVDECGKILKGGAE